MEKDFDTWNHRKTFINNGITTKQCHAGQVWITSVGVNIGAEIDGKNNNFSRPVLVLKRCNRDTFIGVPLTKTLKLSNNWYISCNLQGISGSINLSQIRLFDQKRLMRLVESFSKEELDRILKLVRSIFE
jgi:mRNA interferase MazF